MKTPCFTLNYAAPEVLKQALPSSSKSSNSTTIIDSSLGSSSSTHSSSELFTINGCPNLANVHTTNHQADEKLTSNLTNGLGEKNVDKDVGYNESCDLWSLGVILYTMLAGKAPFQSSSRDLSAAKIMTRINEAEFSFSEPQWSCVSQSLKDIIKKLLNVNPQERMTLSDLIQHPWLKTFVDNPYSQDLFMGSDCLTYEAPYGQRIGDDTFQNNNSSNFHLMDVAKAPLAKRRIQKKSSDVRSSRSSSGMSSFSASTQTTINSNLSQTSICTPASALVQKTSLSDNDYVFNYSECKVNAYLSGLSSDESIPLDVKNYGMLQIEDDY